MHCNNTLILYRIVLRYVIIYGSTHYVQMIYICLILSYPILSYHILSYISNDYGYFISYENADFPYIFYIYISDCQFSHEDLANPQEGPCLCLRLRRRSLR